MPCPPRHRRGASARFPDRQQWLSLRATSAALLARGHDVDALCRAGSERRLAPGVVPVIGDPLEADSYQGAEARSRPKAFSSTSRDLPLAKLLREESWEACDHIEAREANRRLTLQ